jgi:zinc transport system ATP-binding protein
LEELRKRMTVLTVSHDLGFVNSQVDSIICVNKVVSIHQAASFTAETANAIYHHEVNLIQHEHSCFCCCEGERCSK